ncbi:aminotransferase-like domain-containing protein [Amycolatopsis jiangsuensis]|uniref:2-aminoadipate transaminase n=1 Tax=Amycolatopsis jiangsuensis TaxID=1181879 RepID=A0A840ITE5_9PSEU|nr:PLP-dependent aminotransferase family protein [Amycolatopsis jiangsuensis]MBB4684428.1 2-aminoadipate transaminase [Amycolatopsis jiangsuensis]
MPDPRDFTPLISQRTRRGASDAIRDILAAAASPGVLSLAGGLPAAETFPRAAVRDAVDRTLSHSGTAALQYAPTEGVGRMRECAAELAGRSGAPTTAANVLITSGSQQGLSLVAGAFIEEDDVVALDDPSYLGAVQTFRAAGARLLPVPCDRDGMDTDVLEARLAAGVRCKLVYVVPHFHNPTGAMLSPARRRHLADLADRYGFLIVEDDPYADLAFDGIRHPSLELSHAGVIRLMSLSKTLCPGFRVAALVAPARLTAVLAGAKQHTDLQTNTFGQHVVAELLGTPGFLAPHLAGLRSFYRDRANRFAEVLAERTPWLEFEKPRGGLFVWCALAAPNADSARLARAALDAGVAVVPGAPFCVESDGTRRLRLSYAALTAERMRDAAGRLDIAYARTHLVPQG